MTYSKEIIEYNFQQACLRDLVNALHITDGLKLIEDEE